MKNGEFCNREVVIAERNESIAEIARLMRKHNSGDVVIIERNGQDVYPIGIITDRDIVMAIVAEEIPANSLSAGDIMSLEIHTISAEKSIWDTMEMMRTKGIRRVPIVNEKNILQGILRVDDLLGIIAEEASNLVHTIKVEQEKERKRRA